jgi:hypothetical protein
MQNQIFSIDSAKAIKAQDYGYLNAIHYLAPADLSGFQLCPHLSAGCKALCLGWHSGQAAMVGHALAYNSVRQSRVDKARRFMRDRAAYMRDVIRSIELVVERAARLGFKPCVRLNGSSDIAWEGIKVDGRNVFEMFPDVAFVDYTKNPRRFDRALPANYHLTFSRSETNEAQALELLARGVNVAAVFAGQKPETWRGFQVVDGDLHDLRQLDPRGRRGFVIALSPKGNRAKRDRSGFVIRQAA